MQTQNKVIVVTGGGSGIGRALTLRLVNAGAHVAAIDIHENTLQETQGLAGPHKGHISLHVVNVTDREAVNALPEKVIAAHGVVDGLINCAGIIQPFVRIKDLEFDAIKRVLDVNLYGQIHMIKAFLPHLLARPEAHIVNISSMGGFFPVPGQTMYGASKAAVKLLTEGLYAEMIGTNVHVTVVFPGAIATNIAQNSGVMIAGLGNEQAHKFSATTAAVAAETIINGMVRNKFQVFIGQDARMMDLLYRLNPRWATQFMFSKMKALLPD